MIDTRPTSILIAAIGGEGGGVLADWVVTAARASDLWVQATSIPGVAQRTGATTYYIELMPKSGDSRRPVFALTASPGNVDLMVASELLEAGRAVENGYITPDRTTVIASTHRFYAMVEKTATTDGRFDAERITAAVEEMARQPILHDLKALSEQAGTIINAVLLGAMAGSGALPIPSETLKQAIVDGGIAIEANLRGFDAGLALATGTAEPDLPIQTSTLVAASDALEQRIINELPERARDTARHGVNRLIDYQGAGYARLYLDRLRKVVETDATHGAPTEGFDISLEVARRLALWMAFEDLIRVADLKIRPERMARVREEVRSETDQIVTVTEFLKPGVEEAASLMPPGLGRATLRLADRLGVRHKWNMGMHVKTTSASGYLPMWILSRLKRWRPRSLRYAEEQQRIEKWLDKLGKTIPIDRDVALLVVRSAKLVRGYSDTHTRGVATHALLMGQLDACLAEPEPVARFQPLFDAAMNDPDGDSLEQMISQPKEAA